MPGPPIIIDGGSDEITITFPNGEIKVAPNDSFGSITIQGSIPIGPIPLNPGKDWKIIIE
jgi:hypothetical protein